MKENRGGKRNGAGRKKGEPTKNFTVRIPIKQHNQLTNEEKAIAARDGIYQAFINKITRK